jgi:hypothetical protein
MSSDFGKAGRNNWIWISHLDETPAAGWVLPCSPTSITDSMESNFASATALGRSAPIYTYSHSGPRTVVVDLAFRIDAFEDDNMTNPYALLVSPGEYKCDSLIRALQAISLPKYDMSNKAIEPPLVALRLSNEVFIKGVVTSPIQVTYELPIIYGDRYSVVKLSLTVTEVDPYDASAVFKSGSFRGVVGTLRNKLGL